ncbi:type II toxin-antitoxin system RelE/ParE family toxin [Streptococcus pluranimalium]|uniref:type II toxin-antitoxin system RelE/ParE family toxin n=1 Tax=Streptococcus pluranimalium TaxID=82348 RepID=UPI0039FCD9F0
MVKILWSDKASLDLSDIFQGVLRVSFSENIARNKVSKILETIKVLETFPELGKTVKDNFNGDWSILDELDAKDVRTFPSEKYWIVYDCRLDDGVVELLRIIHQSRDMHRIFK